MADPGVEREGAPGCPPGRGDPCCVYRGLGLAVAHVFKTGDVERGQFREAQAGRIEEFEHRFVAHRHGIFGRNVEQAIGLIRRQNLGQGLGALRRAHTLDRVEHRFAAQPEPTVETAPGGKGARQRTSAKTTHEAGRRSGE